MVVLILGSFMEKDVVVTNGMLFEKIQKVLTNTDGLTLGHKELRKMLGEYVARVAQLEKEVADLRRVVTEMKVKVKESKQEERPSVTAKVVDPVKDQGTVPPVEEPAKSSPEEACLSHRIIDLAKTALEAGMAKTESVTKGEDWSKAETYSKIASRTFQYIKENPWTVPVAIAGGLTLGSIILAGLGSLKWIVTGIVVSGIAYVGWKIGKIFMPSFF